MPETKLFTPLKIRDCVFPNRMFIPPMDMFISKDGMVNDESIGYYADYAHRGFGGIVQEATSVTYDGRISPLDLGIWCDEQISGLKRIVDVIHLYNCKAGIQLAHAGRKGSTYPPGLSNGRQTIPAEEGGWDVKAPSAIPYASSHATPIELTVEGIQEIKSAFVASALRAVTAGYDFIQIHAAHGYLLHEFLSPITNHRTDAYGGSFENRTRIVREIVQAIRQVIPAGMPLIVRFSVTDYVSGGWSVDETCRLVRELVEQCGMDAVDCSTAALSCDQVIPREWDHQLKLAAEVKRQTGAVVIAVGGIGDATTATYAADELGVDAIDIGKAALRHAFNPRSIARELGQPTIPFPRMLHWASGVPSHLKI